MVSTSRRRPRPRSFIVVGALGTAFVLGSALALYSPRHERVVISFLIEAALCLGLFGLALTNRLLWQAGIPGIGPSRLATLVRQGDRDERVVAIGWGLSGLLLILSLTALIVYAALTLLHPGPGAYPCPAGHLCM